MAKASTAKTQGLADLARSGLTAEDASALGLEFWSAEETARHFPKAGGSCSIHFPYLTPFGKPQGQAYRVRFLSAPVGAFGEVPVKWQRYGQLKGSEPGVYFPSIRIDWPEVIKDANQDLIITEGEKKAAKGCKEGFPTIGLGGVWSFMSKARGYDLLPILRLITWTGRKVYICYDSDVAQKKDVAKATLKLIDVLTDLGALVYTAPIPELAGGKKAGLDDFLVAEGIARFQSHLSNAQGRELAKELWGFNEQFSFVKNPGIVVVNNTAPGGRPRIIDPNKFVNTIYANRRVAETRIVNDEPVIKQVSVPAKWMEWSARGQHEEVTYWPGKDMVIEETDSLNLWRGFATEPKKGDVTPWKKLLAHLFTGAEDADRIWFERWCGYPIKFPGTKQLTAVGIWSTKQGQGKTLLGETLGCIYGTNFISIPQHSLDSDHNAEFAQRQLVLVDDVSAHYKRERADYFKKLITQEKLLVNEKFIPKFEVPDFANYYLTSNCPDAFYVEDHDRRLFIHEVKVGKLSGEFYDAYYKWMQGPGPSALHYYFLETLDFGDYHPKHAAPMTASKEVMIAGVRNEVDDFIANMGSNGDLQTKDVWSVGDLCATFNGQCLGRKVSANAFSLKLHARLGECTRKVRTKTRTISLASIRNHEKWVKALSAEWARAYDMAANTDKDY